MRLGNFQIVRQLGRGSLGSTYLCIEPPSTRHLVVKAISVPADSRARIAPRLHALIALHAQVLEDRIVRFESFGETDDGVIWLTMRAVDGVSLDELTSSPTLNLRDKIEIVLSLMKLLSSAHRQGLFHGALRRSQVLVHLPNSGSPPGLAVFLLGLGLAPALGPDLGTQAISVSSPSEQRATQELSDQQRAAAQVDILGLGVLWLELLLGQRLTKEMLSSWERDLSDALRASGLSPEAQLLLQAMLQQDPPERGDLSADIEILDREFERLNPIAKAVSPDTTTPSQVPSRNEGGEPRQSVQVGDSVSSPPTRDHGELFGNFRTIRKLGEGGMGVVYEAEHIKIGRRAVVKVLHPEFAENDEYAKRFLNEARAVNIIRHSGLVEIFEFGQRPDGTLYIVMEFLQGDSLRVRLERHNKSVPVQLCLGWIAQLARALSAAHQKGIVHRDLKPENIMVVSDPVRPGLDWVKILDFGIAKLPPKSIAGQMGATSGARTDVGTVMGTPLYMAPEQYGQAETASGKTDVFALGVIFYELLAGKLPYQGNSLRLLSSPVEPVEKVAAGVPPRIADLIGRMMRPMAQDRPTMEEVARVLTEHEGQSRPKTQRSVPIIMVAALLTIVVAVGIGLVKSLRPPSIPEIRNHAFSLVKTSLNSSTPDDRVLAVSALGKSMDVAFRTDLEPLLGDSSPIVVAMAARGLGEIGAVESQRRLLTLASGSLDVQVRLEAVTALARLSHPKGLESLRDLCRQGDDLVRIEASLRLLEFGDRDGLPLLRRFTERESVMGAGAVPVLAALARVGDEVARDKLKHRLAVLGDKGSPDPLVAFSLARVGDPSARSLLVHAANDHGPGQIMAARLLASLGDTSGQPLLLNTCLDHKQPEAVREIAIEGLADSGLIDAAFTLSKLLTERGLSKRLQTVAAGAILRLAAGEPGLLASRSLNWARAALGSDSKSTREIAVMILGDLEAEQSIGPLRLALKDRETEIRTGAARALGRKTIREALEALADSLDDSADEVRTTGMQSIRQVVSALKQKGDRDAGVAVSERLRKMAEQGSELDRVVAGGTLLHLGDPSYRQTVTSGLRSDSALVRRLAVELSDVEPVQLRSQLDDSDPQVQLAAARRLAAIGYLPALTRLQAAAERGGIDGLLSYSFLRKRGEQVAVPRDLLSIVRDGSLREKESALDILNLLPEATALSVVRTAVTDPVGAVRRRAIEVAGSLLAVTNNPELREIILAQKMDPDVTVRSLVASLMPQLQPRPDAVSSTSSRRLPDAKPALPERQLDLSTPRSIDDMGASGSNDAGRTEEGVLHSIPALTSDHDSTDRGRTQTALGTELLLVGDDIVRVQVDDGTVRTPGGPPIPLSVGKHRISYLGGTQEVTLAAGQRLSFQIPVSAGEQLLHDAVLAFQSKEFVRCLALVDKASRKGIFARLKPEQQAELLALQGRAYEARQLWPDAMNAYGKYLKLPLASQRNPSSQLVKAGVDRLATKLGRIQIFTMKDGRCQLAEQYYLPSGEHIIGVGGGETRTVSIDAGATTQLRQCQ